MRGQHEDSYRKNTVIFVLKIVQHMSGVSTWCEFFHGVHNRFV